VSSYFKGQLDDLMTTLYKTSPHFIRCVVPNTHKQPGGVEPELVMHQYQCNGVLAGIAICRAGFPNKMLYPEFKQRFNILAAKAVAKAKNNKSAASAVLDYAVKLDPDKFRLGHTKVFFRAGIAGYMEECREDKIASVVSWLQAGARGKASRMEYKALADQRKALISCQKVMAARQMEKTWKWMEIWNAIRPNLKCTKFCEYQEKYEAQIKEAEANIGRAIKECTEVTDKYAKLEKEKDELATVLASGDSAVQDVIDKTNRAEAARDEVFREVKTTEQRIKNEEEQIVSVNNAAEKSFADADKMKNEMKNIENNCAMCEEDRATKDGQIKTLHTEITHQEDMVSKLSKEKAAARESRQKTEEDIQVAEDRCNHIGKVKGKLEQSLDEAEDALERERKCKGDVEKIKRKVEGDLKLTQETVTALEHVKANLGQNNMRKEKECSSMGAKIEDEKTLGMKYARQLKELKSRIDELEEEIIVERQHRGKAEKNRAILSRDLEEIGTRLEEAGSNTSTQIELNKRREQELARLKEELEELHIAHEGQLAMLRNKQNNTMADMGEQIDNLNKQKGKAELDKAGTERDLQDARHTLDEAMRDHANMEKNCKMSQGLIAEANSSLDDIARNTNDADTIKKKLSVEQDDLNRQIEETENAIGSNSKSKTSLATQLEDTKRLADSEANDRANILTKFKNLSSECERLKMLIEEEADKKNDNVKALSKAQAEIQLWKSKYEVEACGKIDELESSKQKIGAHTFESEEQVEGLNGKIAQNEKTIHRLEAELEEISMEYERAHTAATICEKRGNNFEKVLDEWKVKAEDLMSELEACRSESRNYSSEVFRMKAANDETVDQLDIVRRENKNLADEVKDLLDQLGDGGRSIHELDKQRRRLELEKEELQAALEEAEGALEQEENKVLRAQLELAQTKQEIDRKIAEKEDEFDNCRKNHARAMESMQASLEFEQNAKSESLRNKKNLEAEINDLEIALDHANKANNEAQKSIKRYQQKLSEATFGYEEETRARQELGERANLTERRCCALAAEVDEAKALLDSADRGKKQIEYELSESRHAVIEMTSINSKSASDKRSIEGTVHTMYAEIDDMLHQAKNYEEKAKKAMVDAGRLADELRSEQDHVSTLERNKKTLQSQLHDLENKFAEASENAMRGGRNALSKLEQRIHGMETELGSVQAHTNETAKQLQKAERRSKELAFTIDEDKKNQDRMSDLAGKLQAKVKTYKRQIEDAEEIAALNLAKFRKAQQDLEEVEERTRVSKLH